MKATERLARHGIAFEKHDGRLVIRHSGRVIRCAANLALQGGEG